jgi:hypothetical protein
MAKPNEIDAPDEGKTLSRRELLPLAGKTAVGVAGLSVLASGGLALGCGGDADDDSGAATTGGSAEWPWPYRQLAVADSQPIAYDSWYDKFCCYAVVNAIFGPLKDKVGAPYTAFPNAATKWGHGGAVGWGTLCGTLTGAGIVTGLIAGEIGESILNDVINWYTPAIRLFATSRWENGWPRRTWPFSPIPGWSAARGSRRTSPARPSS